MPTTPNSDSIQPNQPKPSIDSSVNQSVTEQPLPSVPSSLQCDNPPQQLTDEIRQLTVTLVEQYLNQTTLECVIQKLPTIDFNIDAVWGVFNIDNIIWWNDTPINIVNFLTVHNFPDDNLAYTARSVAFDTDVTIEKKCAYAENNNIDHPVTTITITDNVTFQTISLDLNSTNPYKTYLDSLPESSIAFGWFLVDDLCNALYYTKFFHSQSIK